MKKKIGSEKRLSRTQNLNLVALGSFLSGALLTGVAVVLVQTGQPVAKARALRASDIPTAQSAYAFIDPLIGIKGVNNSAKYSDMQKEIAAYIATQQKGALITASVDFRDINEPGGFAINPTEKYTPASLNKVQVMMAYYKIAETDPAVLSDEITYSGAEDRNAVEEIKSAVQLTPGAAYTAEQLIEHLIRYSDNNAANLLLQHLSDTNRIAAYTAVFSELGINPSVLTQYTDNVAVQQYSMFLRSLYNATYLSRANSERALRLLSETDFTEGIESGVPNGTPVAQKFGEVRMTDASGMLLGKEINNCGIVYYPGHPYLLCIMTKAKGDDIQALENNIASISRIIYKHMQDFYPL